jgi:hypothetical protein
MTFWAEVISNLKGMLIVSLPLAAVLAAVVLSFLILKPLIGAAAYAVGGTVAFLGVAIAFTALTRIYSSRSRNSTER